MNIADILDQAAHSGRAALTEYQSKQILNRYNIPVVSEIVAREPAVEEGPARLRVQGLEVVAQVPARYL